MPAPLAVVMNCLSQALTGLVYGLVGPGLREENQPYIFALQVQFLSSVVVLSCDKSNLGIFHSITMSPVIPQKKTCGSS